MGEFNSYLLFCVNGFTTIVYDGQHIVWHIVGSNMLCPEIVWLEDGLGDKEG